MPIDNSTLPYTNDNSSVIGKIQSFIRKNALHHQRIQRLKKFQSLQKSINVKRISINKTGQYYKLQKAGNTNGNTNDTKGQTITIRQSNDQISTIESLKQKIQTLEKDDISDADLEIKLSSIKLQSNKVNAHNTEKQAQQMIQNYRKARNRASQFRSEKILEIIHIKKTIGQDKKRPKVKSLLLANRTSKEFMRSVYLKFINGQEKKNVSPRREIDKMNFSVTAKRFYEQKKTHYRCRSEMCWKDCEQQSQQEVRVNRIKRFKAMYQLMP